MKFWENLKYRIITSLQRQNRMALWEKSFIHPSVSINSAIISGEVFIDEGCKIIKGVTISAEKPVTIGRYTSINGPSSDVICAVNPVRIGSFCSIARNVNIQEYNHRFDRITSYFIFQNVFQESKQMDVYSNGPIEIGNDVWIGAQCVILSGTKIGDGAIIGANSVVSGEIPPYAIALGSPAKVIKYRFDKETIDLLVNMKWWEWSIDKIKANKGLFEKEIAKESLQEIFTKNVR